MCVICVQFQQNKLTLLEARRNFAEMRETMDSEHAAEVDEMLWSPSTDSDVDDYEQLDFFDVFDYPQYAGNYFDDMDDIICSD